MNAIKKTVVLLNTHGLLAFTALMFAGAITSFCLYFFGRDFDSCMLFALLFLLMGCWNIADVRWMDKVFRLKTELADLKDKLCLSEHKADSLRLELETTQSALKEAQKKVASRMVPIHNEPMTERANVALSESADKPKVQKRKPSIRRKPKTEEKE